MMTFETNVRIAEMQRSIGEVKESINQLLVIVKPEEELWDNSELIRRWKISERTLAEWRAKKKISYIQVGKKIYYTKEDRDRFMEKYHINEKRHEHGERN